MPDGSISDTFCSFIMLLFDYIQYLLCMNLCLDFLWSEDSFNDSFLIDKVGGAECADCSATASHLLTPCSKRLEQLGTCVSNKWELQALCISKFLLQLLLVFAYTDNLIAKFCQFLLMSL